MIVHPSHRQRHSLTRLARTIALIACLGAAAAISACAGTSGAPSTPVLLGVGDRSCGEIPPGITGGFRLLPAEAVRLRVAAAWPSADLVVKANGTELENVGPSNTQRQSDLKAAGVAYWIPVDIDPNPTTPAWTVHVELPQSMRAGPLTLTLASRTPGGAASSPLSVDVVRDMTAQAPAWNRVELGWRDRIGESGYFVERSTNGGPYKLLAQMGPDAAGYVDTSEITDETKYSYRLTALGCGPSGPVEVVTPSGPKTGVETITLHRSSPNSFVYTSPLLLFAPRWDAVVSSVINVAETLNGSGVSLGAVRHTDSKGVSASENPSGANCPGAIALPPQASSARFNGLTVTGQWTAEAVCISNALLPDLIDLRITWRAP